MIWTELLSKGTPRIGLFFKFIFSIIFVLFCFVLVPTIVTTWGNANRICFSKNLPLNA